MPLSKDLQRPTKTSKDLIIGNQNVVLSTNLEWVTAETAKASSNLINKLGLLSLVLPKLEKQIRYTVYTLGAGPKPVCHQFTGANFTWNS